MTTRDTDTDICGGLKKIFVGSSEKQNSAPGAATLKQIIATAVDKGIFAAIKACAEEGHVVFHPKEIEDEAKKLKERATKLRQQEEFEDAQEAAELYRRSFWS